MFSGWIVRTLLARAPFQPGQRGAQELKALGHINAFSSPHQSTYVPIWGHGQQAPAQKQPYAPRPDTGKGRWEVPTPHRWLRGVVCLESKLNTSYRCCLTLNPRSPSPLRKERTGWEVLPTHTLVSWKPLQTQVQACCCVTEVSSHKWLRVPQLCHGVWPHQASRRLRPDTDSTLSV